MTLAAAAALIGLLSGLWVAPPLFGQGEPEPATALSPFRPFLGKTWRALVDEERRLYDVARWELAIGGQAIRIVHSVGDGQYEGQTIVAWDKAREELVYFYFTTAGFYTQGTMWFDDSGRLHSRETVQGNEAGVTEVQATQEVIQDGSLKVVTRMRRNGNWEERGNAIYKVAPNAEVVLPD